MRHLYAYCGAFRNCVQFYCKMLQSKIMQYVADEHEQLCSPPQAWETRHAAYDHIFTCSYGRYFKLLAHR